MSTINFPIMYINNPAQGKPIFNGKMYFGKPDLDPVIFTNQKQVYYIQENGDLVAASQPIILSAGGNPTYNGDAVTLGIDGEYSTKVLNKLGVQEYYVARTDSSGDSGSVITYAEDSQTLSDGQLVVDFTGITVAVANIYVGKESGDRGKLFEGDDYEVTGGSQITLTSSFNSGTKLIAASSELVSREDPVKELSQAYEFSTVEDYKAYESDFVVGKVINLLDRGASFTVIDGTLTANNFNIIASDQVSQSIDLILTGEFLPTQWGALGDFDGVTGFDNSPVYQAIIDQMPVTGGTIFTSIEGSYLFSSTVTSGLKRNIYMKGVGRFDFLADEQSGTVEFAANSAIFLFDFGQDDVTNASGHSFRDFGMRDYSGTALGGIALRRTSHNRFYDLQTKNFDATGAIAYFIDGTNDAGFLHEFQGCESRNCDKTVKLIEANATRWYGGFIADGEVGIELSDPSDELFFAGSIDNCTVGIDSKSDSLITSSISRFEVNTTEVKTTRNNNKIDGFFNNNTLDVDISSGVNNVIMGHRAVGQLIVTDNGTDTKFINKEGITVPTLTLTESLFLKRGLGISQITANQNDYDPSSASLWALSASVPVSITGIGSPSDGRRLTITNNGVNDITFDNDSVSSEIVNRIRTKGSAVLSQDGTIEMYYDTSVSRWIISSVR